MARRKTPYTLAVLTGAAEKHPERYRANMGAQDARALGNAPAWLSSAEKAAWATFAQELPWLVASDRALLASACSLRAMIQTGGDVSAAHIRELRMHLTALGATPTARHSVTLPEEPDESGPWAAFEDGG